MIDLHHLKGKFITFEGGDGSGKTTIAKHLYEEFIDQNIDVVLTHDPGGTKVSNDLRKIIFDKDSGICSNAEMLLFAASRAQLTSEVIEPALTSGTTVICDRWYDSTVVYQGVCEHHDREMLQRIFEYTCDTVPDITFLMNVDAATGLKRSYEVLNGENINESKFEDYGLKFQKKVNMGFIDLAYTDSYYTTKDHLLRTNRIKIINANKNLEHCLEKLNNFLNDYRGK